MEEAKVNDYKKLLLTFDGRLGVKGFWSGIKVLIIASAAIQVLSALLGPLGLLLSLLSLALIYPFVCVYIKRFHDADMPGIWVLAVIGGYFVASMIVSAVLTPIFVGDVMARAASGMLPSYGLGYTLIMMVADVGIQIGAAYIVAQIKGTDGDNKYGPPPAE